MKENLKKILSNATDGNNQDLLMKYLNGTLDDTNKHEFEKLMLDNDFENDALEGLQKIENQEKIQAAVEVLNRDLKKRVAKKTKARKKLDLQPQWWLYFSILIFLLIIVLIFLFLHVKSNP